jgi:hypothetical protein
MSVESDVERGKQGERVTVGWDRAILEASQILPTINVVTEPP